jgi:hypothetical protein
MKIKTKLMILPKKIGVKVEYSSYFVESYTS